jgi:hypothetical protein
VLKNLTTQSSMNAASLHTVWVVINMPPKGRQINTSWKVKAGCHIFRHLVAGRRQLDTSCAFQPQFPAAHQVQHTLCQPIIVHDFSSDLLNGVGAFKRILPQYHI